MNTSLTAFSGSYLPSDVQFLLTRLPKDAVMNIDPAQKEVLIQSGKRHYSQMLTLENAPNVVQLALYHESLNTTAWRLAKWVHELAFTLWERFGQPIVLVSLVRAGVPLGVLLQRAFADVLAPYHCPSHHYGISIIRDKGIDHHALSHIIHAHPDCPIVFVDGWTGKGAIFNELSKSLHEFCRQSPHARSRLFDGDMPTLTVFSDPAGVAWLSACDDDVLIGSSLLGATISGLISRTLYRDEGFHGCVFYEDLLKFDESLNFINRIDALRHQLCQTKAKPKPLPTHAQPRFSTQALIQHIGQTFGITNPNYIKPTIAEATRAILRRQPHCVLLNDDAPQNPELTFIRHLCDERNIPIIIQNIKPYQAITLIKTHPQSQTKRIP